LEQARFIACPLTAVPVQGDSFDLVWNFLATATLPQPRRYLLEMKRISRRLLLLVCANAANYGYPVYMATNALTGAKGKFGAKEWFRVGYVRQELRNLGMKVIEAAPIDVPPWPGFEGLITLLRRFHRPSPKSARGESEDLEAVSTTVRRYSFLEASRLPRTVKYIFGHLFYVLAEKQ
jgi:SAM-dependent methyltransferase